MTVTDSCTAGNTVEQFIDEGIATLFLNRPALLNSLNGELIKTMRGMMSGLRADKEVRVLVISGRGRGFCSGVDLKDPILSNSDPANRLQTFHAFMDNGLNGLIRDIYDFDRPTVAAVNGVAAGGGIGLALSADIVLAAKSAYFVQVFAPQLGLIPDLGCTWHLPRLLGRARSIGLAMLGDRLSAQQAADWGLIWRAVEDDALEAESRAIAIRLRDGAPRALAAVSKAIDHGCDVSLSNQLDYERDVQSVLYSTEDFREAVTAFNDKRKPVFKGN